MIVSLVNTIVGQLTVNATNYDFSHGSQSFSNLINDEMDKPVVHLNPPENDYVLSQSGFIGEKYYLSLLFMFKSQLDWTPAQHETNAIDPANNAIRQFISLCQASNLIDKIELTSKSVEFINLLDVGVSGKFLFCAITPNIDKSVCV